MNSCSVPPDSKEPKLGSSQEQAFQSVGKNTGVVLVPMSRMKMCPYSYFQWCGYFRGPWVSFTYSPSYNLTPPISPVMIGQHLIFCSMTSPTYWNSPRKCTPVKYKKRQKTWVSNCHIDNLFVTTDTFSVRVTKITSRIGVLWTHSLSFCFWALSNSWNDHIIKRT